MTSGQPAVQATQLSKSFIGRPVLREIDLRIAGGETIILTGANGAGKTTLLRCLAGRLRPDAGAVHWHGQLARANPRDRRLIGMVAHESRLYPHLTLRENLVFAARMYGIRSAKPAADAALEKIGLLACAACYPNQVSQGMRQRVALARALLHDPPIVFLDEPLAGLDTAGTDWLVRLLDALRRNQRTICVASHHLGVVGQLADRIVCLRRGRLGTLHEATQRTADGPPTRQSAA